MVRMLMPAVAVALMKVAPVATTHAVVILGGDGGDAPRSSSRSKTGAAATGAAAMEVATAGAASTAAAATREAAAEATEAAAGVGRRRWGRRRWGCGAMPWFE